MKKRRGFVKVGDSLCHEPSTQAKGGKVEVVQLRLFKAKERRETLLLYNILVWPRFPLASISGTI